MIVANKHQQIATHTFSPLGQKRGSTTGGSTALSFGEIRLILITCPRAAKRDFTHTEEQRSWLHAPCSVVGEPSLRRGARLVDACLNLTGHHTVSLKFNGRNIAFNIAQSRFLRPYSSGFVCAGYLPEPPRAHDPSLL